MERDVIDYNVDRRVDWIGASLVTVGLVLIVFVLGQGQIASQGWGTPCMNTHPQSSCLVADLSLAR